MKYEAWDNVNRKMVEKDTDNDNLYNIWYYKMEPEYHPDIDDVSLSEGWELHGAADSLEEISPNILSSKEFKVTYNGKEITS